MSKKQYCANCGNIGKGTVRGSLAITLLLLCFFIVPGIIYELWREGGGRKKCKSCGAFGMIPVDSPNAKKLMAEKQEA